MDRMVCNSLTLWLLAIGSQYNHEIPKWQNKYMIRHPNLENHSNLSNRSNWEFAGSQNTMRAAGAGAALAASMFLAYVRSQW